MNEENIQTIENVYPGESRLFFYLSFLLFILDII